MLIDATHEEETRVVIVKGNKIEEFDFEAANRRQLKGNIYLAKVTRVEPSLQAAFVDFGGNRHGFLAFSEIHPDYYQIPAADRALLLKEEAEAAAEANREEERYENKLATNTDDVETADEEDGNNRRGGRNNNRRRGRRNNTRFNRLPARGIFTSLPADEAKAEEANQADSNPNASNQNVETEANEERNPRGRGRGRGRGGRGYRGRGRNSSRMGNRPLRGVYTSLPPYVAVLNEDTPFEKYDQRNNQKSAAESAGLTDSVKSEQVENTSGVVSIFDQDTEDNTDDIEVLDNSNEAQVEEAQAPVKRKARSRKRYEIQQVIKRRQIILVQVVKEERGNKGAALTTYLSLAGRYCVLMPNTPKGGGISRKITNAPDRKRLKEVAESLILDEGMGLIVRTAGANRTKMDIKRDYEYLIRLWENVRNLTLRSVAPHLVYEEGNLIKRSIRDLYDRDIDAVIVSGDQAYKEAKAFMTMLMPSHAKKVLHYKEAQPIFIRHHIEQQLDTIYSPNVTLKSGGYLVINQTEALVSIDINSGKSTKENSIENTAVNTNLEAAEEIARQLRLRDLAGLVVIDFIDMEENRNNRAVEKRMKDCLASDRARIQVGRISHFGLLEMSRQRLRASLLEGSTDMCPHCHGTGLIRSNSSMALHILNALEHQLIQGRGPSLNILAPLNITMFLLNNKRQQLFEIEGRYNARVNIEVDPHLEGVSYRIETSTLEVTKRSTDSAIRLESEYGSDDELETETATTTTEEKTNETETVESTGDDDGRKPRRNGRRNSRGRNNGRGRRNSGDDSQKTAETVAEVKVDAEKISSSPSNENSVDGKAAEAEVKPAQKAESNEAADTKESEKPKRRTRAKAKTTEAKSGAVKASAAKTETLRQATDEKPDADAKQGWWSRRFSRN
ncbi:MAG: Rne/Rng family ribonuclease [Alphaproteobacteria bacterium]|nr:Rne/Rng family ribonuclease [Alphaproteobacteria bacterium]